MSDEKIEDVVKQEDTKQDAPVEKEIVAEVVESTEEFVEESIAIHTISVGDFAFQLQEAVQNGFSLREDPRGYPHFGTTCEAHLVNGVDVVASESTDEIVELLTPNFGEFAFLIQSLVAAGYTVSTLIGDFPSLGTQFTAKMVKDGVVLKEKNKGGRPRGTTKKR